MENGSGERAWEPKRVVFHLSCNPGKMFVFGGKVQQKVAGAESFEMSKFSIVIYCQTFENNLDHF